MENTALTKSEENALVVSFDVNDSHVELDMNFVKNYLVRGRAELISNQEIMFFMNLCKSQHLNPLTGGEVYLIKYSQTEPAQIVVGKTAYLKRAFEHPDYLCKEDGIVVLRNGEVIHKEGTCVYPGEILIGGWCRVHFMRKGRERDAYKEVSYDEYNKGQANWKSKPATMVNKVAVSQCVREAFPKDFEGLYSEEEMIASGTIPADYTVVEEQTVDEGNTVINQEQRQELLQLISDNFCGNDRRNEVFKEVMTKIGLTSMKNMTLNQLNAAKEEVIRITENESVESVNERVENEYVGDERNN